MDKNNVIVPTDDIEELKLDYNKWDSTLTYDEKKRSNMECEELYGCNNMELFDKLYTSIMKVNDSVNESGVLNTSEDFFDDWDLLNKIKTSQVIMDQEHDVIILIDYPHPMDISKLEDLYNKFQSSITYDRRLMSDRYSLEIWGKTVTDMYSYIKKKINSLNSETINTVPIKESVTDATLTQFVKSYRSSDPLRREIMKIDAYTAKDTFYEDMILRESIEQSSFKEFCYNDNLHNTVTPWFTPTEYTNLTDKEVNPFDYIFVENAYNYVETIKKLRREKNNAALIQLGWNPIVPITGAALEDARSKQIGWLNENERKIRIIDISGLNSNLDEAVLEAKSDEENGFLDPRFILKPIHIVLSYTETAFGKVIRAVKGSEYSHAAISFDTSLDNMYSFNFQPQNGVNGISKESIKDYNNKENDAQLMVNTIFVPTEVWKKIKANVDYYVEKGKETKYGFANLLNIVFNKAKDSTNSLYMVCSQFVDNLLKMANIDITHKSSNLVAPGDFEHPTEDMKVFTVFKGNKKSYKRREVDKKIKTLEKINTIKQLNVMESADLLKHISSGLIENFFTCDTENIYIHESLKTIREMLTIEPIIVVREFKSPVRFTDLGELSIDLPKNLQNEYNEAHKLLSLYDVTNLNGIKHEVARLFYLNGIIEKKLKRVKKTDKDFKTYMDLRARILNDYSTYFKIIKQAEPTFDFMDYLKGTEYWNKTVTIDGSTLKYTGAYIKKAIELLK